VVCVVVQGRILTEYVHDIAKETILESEIFRIIEKMPKGALLHAHLEAM
jgi:hypothetical protein